MQYENGKLPPQAIDLEESVLGSMLEYKNSITIAVDILKPEAFYKDNHQKIFQAICDLFKQSTPVDILTVTQRLKKKGQLEEVGGSFYITQLTSKASISSTEYNSRLIYEKYLQRELITAGAELSSNGYDDTVDVFDLVDHHQAKIFSIISDVTGKSFSKVGDIVASRLLEYEKVPQGGLTGVGSSLGALDRVTSGWQPSDLVIIAARPAMGKTAFVMSCARNASIDYQKPGAIFSLEMSKEQLVDRLISNETEIYLEKLKKRTISDWEWQQMHNRISKLVDAEMYIDDTPGLNIVQFRAKCRRLKELHDIQWIIVDYLQLMQGDKSKKGNREQEISDISRQLKIVAKELEVPVLALSQLSRAVESRPGAGKRPMLSDLRESGSIEQDADMVIFLYRPEYYGLTEDEEGRSTAGVCELIIAKNRHGVCDTVPVRFNGALMKFTDLEDSFNQTPQKIYPSTMSEDLDEKGSFILPRSEEFEEPLF